MATVQMTPAEVFATCGRVLFGQHFVAPMATKLGVDKNTVGKFANGKSRIPPGVWSDLAGIIQDREREPSLAALKGWALEFADPRPAMSEITRFLPSSIVGAEPSLSSAERAGLQERLDAFTSANQLPHAELVSDGARLTIQVTDLSNDKQAILDRWLVAEINRLLDDEMAGRRQGGYRLDPMHTTNMSDPLGGQRKFGVDTTQRRPGFQTSVSARPAPGRKR